MNKKVILILFLIPFLISCGRLKGEFSVKYPLDETYRRIHRKPEIRNDQTVKWIYRFKTMPDKLTVGVVVMKKEALWIDYSSYRETVSGTSPILYGQIKNYPPGEYRIVITDFLKENKIIDDLYLQVYSDLEDEELPLE